MPNKAAVFELAKQVENLSTLESIRARYKDSAWLDLRKTTPVEQAHLIKTANLPIAQLSLRVAELPHKKISLVLIGNKDETVSAKQFLLSRKYIIAASITTDSMTAQLWCKLVQDGYANQGISKHSLWSANRFLQQHIDLIENQNTEQTPTALDIGCGSGREAVFLAKRGWRVKAIDNQAEAIHRVNQLATHNNVELEAIEADIIDNNHSFPDESFGLIVMFRFLHRPLFEKIKKWLKPGGSFLVETFSIEAAKFGKPRRKHLMLNPGEIKQYFSEMDVAKEYHRTLSDGRPLIGCFVNKIVPSQEIRVTSKIKGQ